LAIGEREMEVDLFLLEAGGWRLKSDIG